MRYSLLMVLLLLFGCREKEELTLNAKFKTALSTLKVYLSATEIEVQDKLRIKFELTYPADKFIRKMDFISGSYDISPAERINSPARLNEKNQLYKEMTCELYANRFGEIILPIFQVQFTDGSQIQTDKICFNVLPVNPVDTPHSIIETFDKHTKTNWLPVLYTLLPVSLLLLFFKRCKSKVEFNEAETLKEIMLSEASDSEKLTQIYNRLSRNGENPQLLTKVEKAIFDKSSALDIKALEELL